MNPADALPEDWGMYYDGVWMRHTTHGIGQIQVVGGDMYLRKTPKSDPILVNSRYLRCWWPRAGAFNCGDHAIYIARRAMRNMRKSAMSGDHYYITWGSPYGKDMMMVLRNGPNPLPIGDAILGLRSGIVGSVAITRDIILSVDFEAGVEHKEPLTVVFRGMEVGTYTEDGGFVPLFSGSPFTPRIHRQLEEVL